MKFALLGTKRLVSFFAVSACAILMACSSDDDDFVFSNTVEDDVESNSEIQMIRSYDRLPECLKDESARRGYIQLYGKDCLTDGFFISAFRK